MGVGVAAVFFFPALFGLGMGIDQGMDRSGVKLGLLHLDADAALLRPHLCLLFEDLRRARFDARAAGLPAPGVFAFGRRPIAFAQGAAIDLQVLDDVVFGQGLHNAHEVLSAFFLGGCDADLELGQGLHADGGHIACREAAALGVVVHPPGGHLGQAVLVGLEPDAGLAVCIGAHARAVDVPHARQIQLDLAVGQGHLLVGAAVVERQHQLDRLALGDHGLGRVELQLGVDGAIGLLAHLYLMAPDGAQQLAEGRYELFGHALEGLVRGVVYGARRHHDAPHAIDERGRGGAVPHALSR